MNHNTGMTPLTWRVHGQVLSGHEMLRRADALMDVGYLRSMPQGMRLRLRAKRPQAGTVLA